MKIFIANFYNPRVQGLFPSLIPAETKEDAIIIAKSLPLFKPEYLDCQFYNITSEIDETDPLMTVLDIL